MQVYLFLSGMKKIFLLFFCVSMSLISSAQDFKAALLLGANFSQVDGDQLGGYNKLGLNAGIEISRPVNNDWDAAFELRYSMKGSKKVLNPEFYEPSLKISYHYVEVPLVARYKKYEKITPYAGISLGANVYNLRNDNGITYKEEALKKGEVGFLIGGTYHLNEKVGLDLRHSYSLLSIRDYPFIVNGPTWFGRAGWYNRMFTIAVNYNLAN